MKLAWLSDCHFLLDVPALRRPFQKFVQAVAAQRPDAVLLGGDICSGASLNRVLSAFRQIAPTYYTLGNHEFLGSSIAAVQAQAAGLMNRGAGLTWLSQVTEPVWLMSEVALIGADCWGDARVGDLSAHNLRRRGHQLQYDQIEDIRLIWEACDSDTVRIAGDLQNFLQTRGNEAAAHLDQVGQVIAQRARQILVLVHAPPFREATLHCGEQDPIGLPFFCAIAAGDVLRRLAESNPHAQFTVLAGHTHHAAEVHILPNLRVFVHAPGGKGAASKWVMIEVSPEKVAFQTRGMPLDRERFPGQ